MSEKYSSPVLRLFIAINVPPDVRKVIGRAQSQLQRNSPPSAISWTRPEQFHITLKFLGDIPTAQISMLKEVVSKVCAGSHAIQLSAQGIGFFQNLQKPRVIWVGADDHTGQLEKLFRQIDDAVRIFVKTEKPERFTGHITLGRFNPRHNTGLEKLLKRATVLSQSHFGDWVAGEVIIVRSELTSTGTNHTILATYRLTD